MNSFFRKMFSKGQDSAPAIMEPLKEQYIQKFTDTPYNFATVTMAEVLKNDKSLWDLYTNANDGFLIKNFLTAEEVDTIMGNFHKAENDNPAHTPVGFTYPPVFAEFSNRICKETDDKKQEAIKEYFIKTTHYNKHFGTEYGVDVKSRVENFYKAISGGREILVATNSKETGQYPFGTFRYLLPDKGLMSVHCGNYFGKTFEEFYADLTQKVAVENQMSYFIMLQEPEEGGELSLFNFRWKTGQTKTNPSEDNEIIQPDGSKMYVQDDPNITKDKIAPKKGDMILFQGGNIWHKVETVRGMIPRITFGGFIGVSIDKSKIYYWS